MRLVAHDSEVMVGDASPLFGMDRPMTLLAWERTVVSTGVMPLDWFSESNKLRFSFLS